VRRVIGCVLITLVAAGCRGATGASTTLPTAPILQIHESPSPFQEVTAGEVSAVIPDAWHPLPAGGAQDVEEGLIAGPRPKDWVGERAPAEGLAAVWVDGTRVGVPSDYYYLAATGPALDIITHSPRCSATRQTVIVNHRPTFAAGDPNSAGDYIARGQGTCSVGHTATRWAYFVAAPGFGPAREVGIPSSGLYVVVAVLPASRRASALLGKLLLRTEFGGASMSDFIAAARRAA
jgi:hypothetical protein